MIIDESDERQFRDLDEFHNRLSQTIFLLFASLQLLMMVQMMVLNVKYWMKWNTRFIKTVINKKILIQ